MDDTKVQAVWHPYRNAWEAAQAERDKAWREVAATHAASRQKDEQIRKLTRDLRAAEGRAKRARRQLGQLEASYDALLMRHAFENANTN